MDENEKKDFEAKVNEHISKLFMTMSKENKRLERKIQSYRSRLDDLVLGLDQIKDAIYSKPALDAVKEIEDILDSLFIYKGETKC